MDDRAARVLAAAVDEAGGRIIAALAAQFRDLDLAEDGFSQACAAAAAHWSDTSLPKDPAAWLYAAARRRGLDLMRRTRVRGAYRPDPVTPVATPEDLLLVAAEPIPDERLRLVFVCCHPALSMEARMALTLRVVCGLGVEQLGALLLATPATIAQRLTRAKRKIRDAAIAFEVPGRDQWADRLEAVLLTLETAYAQAYAEPGSPTPPLATEVFRLAAILVELLPDEPEVLGLCATIALGEARRPARVVVVDDIVSHLVPLAEQDVGLWDLDLIDHGIDLLARAAGLGNTGPRQLMATIHAAHVQRLETGLTPWTDVVGLYDALLAIQPSPILRLNRAVALSFAAEPAEGLAAFKAIAPVDSLRTYLPYHLAHAHLLTETGETEGARASLDAALGLASNPVERAFLQTQRNRLN